MMAMKRMGANFGEFDSNSTVMIIVEGQQPLGDDAHRYYDQIIARLWRQGQKESHVTVYRILAENTRDMKVAKVLLGKDRTQKTLLEALKS